MKLLIRLYRYLSTPAAIRNGRIIHNQPSFAINAHFAAFRR